MQKTLHDYEELLSSNKIKKFNSTEIASLFTPIGIDDRFIMNHYDDLLIPAINHQNLAAIQYIKPRGVVTGKKAVFLAVFKTNNTAVLESIITLSDMHLSDRVLHWAIEECNPYMVSEIIRINQEVDVSGFELSMTGKCIGVFKILATHILDGDHGVKQISHILTGRTFSTEQVLFLLQELAKESDLSLNNNRIAMGVMKTYKDSKELLSYFSKDKNVMAMAVKMNQTELIPDALKKIFLIKDKK